MLDNLSDSEEIRLNKDVKPFYGNINVLHFQISSTEKQLFLAECSGVFNLTENMDLLK